MDKEIVKCYDCKHLIYKEDATEIEGNKYLCPKHSSKYEKVGMQEGYDDADISNPFAKHNNLNYYEKNGMNYF